MTTVAKKAKVDSAEAQLERDMNIRGMIYIVLIVGSFILGVIAAH